MILGPRQSAFSDSSSVTAKHHVPLVRSSDLEELFRAGSGMCLATLPVYLNIPQSLQLPVP